MNIREIELLTGKTVWLRTCWKCNKAHEKLKEVNYIIWCFECGNMYMNGKILSERKLKKWIKEKNLK